MVVINYKTNLTELELLRLNLIENQSIRNSCMSLMGYLIKLNEKENTELQKAGLEHLKDHTTLKISLRKFLEKYNRGHQEYKISVKTLKLRMDLLQELKLFTVTKINNINAYFFNRFSQGNKVGNKKGNNFKVDQPVATTDVEVVSQKHKYLNNKIKINKDLINRENCPSKTKIFVSSLEEIKEQLEHHISKFNIKYDFAIEEIERRVKKAIKRGTLRFTGVENYLISVLTSIKNYFIPNCFKKKNADKQQANTKKVDSFNNYDQRPYNFDKLEKVLLGESDASLAECQDKEIPVEESIDDTKSIAKVDDTYTPESSETICTEQSFLEAYLKRRNASNTED